MVGGRAGTPVGDISYSLTSIQMSGLSIPAASINIVAGTGVQIAVYVRLPASAVGVGVCAWMLHQEGSCAGADTDAHILSRLPAYLRAVVPCVGCGGLAGRERVRTYT